MYPEFIAIYVGLGILAIMMVAVLVLLIILLRQEKGTITKSKSNVSNNGNQTSGTVVFCKNCATQFDASQHTCPKCGTPR